MTRAEKDWIFVSDAHLTGREPREIELFVRFLGSEVERMGHLVILGDLFEFLFGFRSFPAKKAFAFVKYLPVLERIRELFRRGIRITYFEGNHDFFLSPFFSEQLGMEIEVHPDGCEESLGGKRAYIGHGDLSNPRQWRYRAFRRILKNRWTYGLIQFVGPEISCRVAQRLSSRSYRRYHAGVNENPPPAFKAFAQRKFSEGFEVVILGHSHFPEEIVERVNGRRCLYFNVGDWMIHRSFLRFTPPDRFQLSRYEERTVG